MATKKSQIEKEYKRLRKNALRNINRYKKRGIENVKELPPIPKKITAGSVRRMAQYTPEKLLENAIYTDKNTGEVYQGYRSIRAAERSQRAATRKSTMKRKKAAIVEPKTKGVKSVAPELTVEDTYDAIIDNFRGLFNTFETSEVADELITKWVNQYGKEKTAKIISTVYSEYAYESLSDKAQREIRYSDVACARYINTIFMRGNAVIKNGYNAEFDEYMNEERDITDIELYE